MASQLHEIRNPASGSLLGQVEEQRADQVRAAVARARLAQSAWANQPFRARAAALRKLARALRDDPHLIETLTQESGKPRYEAELFELLYTLELTRFYTSRAGRRALADELRGSTFLPN